MPLAKPIAMFVPDPANARKHDERSYEVIANSLRQFGQRKPIVAQEKDGQFIVRAGNGTLEAAKRLGWTEIAAVIVNEDSVTSTAFAIADNKTAEVSTWDDEVLNKTLRALVDEGVHVEDFGFDLEEFDLSPPSEGLTDPDAVPEVEQNIHNVKLGDVWQLGSHRLMCGDSTVKENVERLMDGKKAAMLFTDPPYNYGSETNCSKQNSGDTQLKNAKWDKDFNPEDVPFFCFLNQDSVGYVFTSAFLFGAIFEAAKEWADFAGMLCWEKTTYNSNLLKKHPTWNVEPIVYFTKGNHVFNYDRSEQKNALIKAATENYTNFVGHPSQKPVKMCEQIMNNSSNVHSLILDLFLGSGSTLIACEKTNRICYGLELDPHYVSVAIERWQQFTGKNATLLSNNTGAS